MNAMGFSLNATELYDYQDHSVPTNTSSVIAELNVPYTVCEILVAICAVFGNGLVIIVFSKERRLRRRTNYYIVSLAAADLLVGLFAIPFAILASIGLPTNLHACLFTTSVLVVLCTISIFCLVAVSVDRYWAILHPMGYSRTVRTKTAIGEGPIRPAVLLSFNLIPDTRAPRVARLMASDPLIHISRVSLRRNLNEALGTRAFV
jgi:adenosine receptor A2a